MCCIDSEENTFYDVSKLVHCIFGMILQVLRKRLQGVMCRLGSDVKDRAAARETEDAINELQRQMGEFERSVSEHQKTLDMTCRLQQAMEEVINILDYLWCCSLWSWLEFISVGPRGKH